MIPRAAQIYTKTFDLLFYALFLVSLQISIGALDLGMQKVGGYDTPGNASGVCVFGHYLFVADGASGVEILDATDPGRLTFVGSIDTPGNASDVTVAGDKMYVADGYAGLQIIEFSELKNPTRIGTYNTPGFASQVVVRDNLAYVADGPGGVQILDISNASMPILVSAIPAATTGSALHVAIQGNFLFVAMDSAGLTIADISNPQNPKVLPTVFKPNAAPQSLAVYGHYLLLANAKGQGGLQIVDIINPAAPVHVGRFNNDGASCVIAENDLALLLDTSGGVVALDISDKQKPKQVGRFPQSGSARGIIRSGKIAYVADYAAGVQAVDVSSPAFPQHLGQTTRPAIVRGVIAYDHYAIGLEEASGMQVFDTSDPHMPQAVAELNLPGSGFAVRGAVAGHYAIIACGAPGVAIVDLANPAAPKVVSTILTAGVARDVFVDGDLAFVADGSSGGGIYDLRELPKIVPIRSFTVAVNGVAVSGTNLFAARDTGLLVESGDLRQSGNRSGAYVTPTPADLVAGLGSFAYVYARGAGIHVVDCVDPTLPVKTAYIEMAKTVSDLKISGGALYAMGSGGLSIFDLSDPGHPTLSSTYSAPGNACSPSGDVAYLANGRIGLEVVNISNLKTPTRLSSGVASTEALTLSVSGNKVFLGDLFNGFHVIDVQNPYQPWRISSYEAPPYIYGIASKGDNVYVSGFYAVDATDPGNLLRTFGVADSYSSYSLRVSGSRLFRAYYAGLSVYDITTPSSPRLIYNKSIQSGANFFAGFGNLAFAGVNRSLQIYSIQDSPPVSLLKSYVSTNLDAYPTDVTVAGHFAYVAQGYAGIEILDISDPANPKRIGGYDTPADARSVRVDGIYAYVADGPCGVEVLDISDPAHPRLAGWNSGMRYAGWLEIADNRLYVAADYEGLVVMDLLRPLRFTAVSADNQSARISLEGPLRIPIKIQAGEDFGWHDWQTITLLSNNWSQAVPTTSSNQFFRAKID